MADMPERKALNWSRGLFRTWVAITALWLVDVGHYLFAKWPVMDQLDPVTPLYWAVALPVGLLALGWGVFGSVVASAGLPLHLRESHAPLESVPSCVPQHMRVDRKWELRSLAKSRE
jgi:hypothetical protein